MAGHEWDWFQREELIGQISDMRVQNLQVERENVQKRTFTRWINLHLEKCDPPLEVHDLFLDIQDGKVLMALLEVMSGQRLLHEYKSSPHRIFRLNNIAKSLKFVEDSNVKLVSIDAAEIADGNPSMVLGLIWNIILFFQIKELTGNLNRMSSSSSLSSVPSGTDSDTSHPSTPNAEKSMSVSIKDQRKAIKTLLHWVQQRTRKYGVAVQDFGSSWRSGLAFLAVVKAIDSSLVDMKEALDKPPRENLEDAFRIAFYSLNIPRLLEPEDIMVDSPDEHSIMTYVAQFLEHFPELEGEDLSEVGSPVQSTYVHYKDGPVEQEGRIVIFNQNEEYAYTANHDSLQPPPPKIFLCTVPDFMEECSLQNSHEKLNDELNPSLSDETQPLPQNVQTVHGGTDALWEINTNNVSLFDDNPGSYNDAQENGLEDALAVLPADGNVVDTVDSFMKYSKLPPLDEAIEPQNNTENLIVLTSASFSSLNPSPGTSDEDSYKIAEEDFFQYDDYLMKGTAATASTFPAGNESPVTPIDEAEVYKYILHLQNEVPKEPSTPEGYEHPTEMGAFQDLRVNTCLMEDARHKGHPDHFRSSRSESVVPSHRPIPGTLNIRAGDVTVPKTSPAKVSVIPHDLFYYPHYSVPISDVLDAFVESDAEESENNKAHKTRPLNLLPDYDSDTLALENVCQPLPKTTIDIAPTKVNEASPVPTIRETRWNVEHQELSPEISNSFSKDSNFRYTNISQTGQIDADTRHTHSGLLSAVKSSAVRVEQRKLNNHTSMKKEASACNGEARIPNYVEANENNFEDASESIMEEEVHGKMKMPRKNTARAKGDIHVGENDLSLIPDELEEETSVETWSPRVSHSDTSIYYRQHDYMEDVQDVVHWVEDENIDSVKEANSQIRVVWENQNSVRASPSSEDLLRWQRAPDIVYLLVFFWILVYSIMILPELDLGKVTFFSHDQ